MSSIAIAMHFAPKSNLQGYQAYASQGEQRGSPTQSQGPSSPHSLLPQGRGSIVYGPSEGYQQQDQSIYTAQGYQVSMLCPLSFCSLMPHSLQIKSNICLLTLICMLFCAYSCCLQRAQTQRCHVSMQGMQQAQRASSSSSMSSGHVSPGRPGPPKGYLMQQYQVPHCLLVSLSRLPHPTSPSASLTVKQHAPSCRVIIVLKAGLGYNC